MMRTQICFISKGIHETSILYCEINDEIKKGSFSFVIDDYSYTIELENFWDCFSFFCFFSIRGSINSDFFLLGSRFYYNYNVLFDQEENKIHFYSEKGVKVVSLPNISSLDTYLSFRILIMIITIIQGIGIGLGIIIKKRMLL